MRRVFSPLLLAGIAGYCDSAQSGSGFTVCRSVPRTDRYASGFHFRAEDLSAGAIAFLILASFLRLA